MHSENVIDSVKLPEHFEMLPERAVFRPVRAGSLREAINLVTMAITCARACLQNRILVDTRGLTGFESPNLVDRYFFIREWADAAGGRVKLALVARPEMIDPGKFGVVVAKNAGMNANVFQTEPEALEWLNA